MTIVRQSTDAAGKIKIIWQLSNGNTIVLYFDEQPSESELNVLDAKLVSRQLYDNVSKLEINIFDDIELIREFIIQVKEHPTLNLTQFNSWLQTKQWYEDVKIRTFIFLIAQELANRNEVILSDFSQIEILQKIRDFIVNTPIRKLAKLIFGHQYTLGE